MMWLVLFQPSVSGDFDHIVATYAGGVSPGMHTLEASVDITTGRIDGELGELVRDAWAEISGGGIPLLTGEQLAWQIQQMLNADV